MTKKDLIKSICNAKPDIQKNQVEAAVNLFFELIAFYLAHHQRVELRGFGSFSVRTRKAHYAHNPQTGEKIFVPEKVTPFFKSSQGLKERLKKQPSIPSEKKHAFFPFLKEQFVRLTKKA
jgi:integration host factor subunit beta